MAEPMKVAYIFPGQGSQWVGMGHDLYDNFDSARTVFKQADDTLGFSLSRLCFNGPEDTLRQTVNAQPAIVTVSLACLKATLTEAGDDGIPPPVFVAGHSLGEYTALAAAGALDFASTIYLARERGRLMYEAGLSRSGGMAAIIGLNETTLTKLCSETDTWIANINCPNQIVISGAKENLVKAIESAKSRGAHHIIPLSVSGAFHTLLMQPAADGIAKTITTLPFTNPTTPIIANTTAQPLTSAELIKEELLKQLCSCIQWQRSVEYMVNTGVSTFIEMGPGKVLSGLIKRIDKGVKTLNIGDVSAIEGIAN